MKKQYSLAYLTILGCPPPEMINIAARTGYDFVSLRPIYMGLPVIMSVQSVLRLSRLIVFCHLFFLGLTSERPPIFLL